MTYTRTYSNRSILPISIKAIKCDTRTFHIFIPTSIPIFVTKSKILYECCRHIFRYVNALTIISTNICIYTYVCDTYLASIYVNIIERYKWLIIKWQWNMRILSKYLSIARLMYSYTRTYYTYIYTAFSLSYHNKCVYVRSYTCFWAIKL